MTGIPQRDRADQASPVRVRRPGGGGAGRGSATRLTEGPGRAADLPGPRGLSDQGAGVVNALSVLLVEDDDGDALLVEELFLTAAGAFHLLRARSLTEAKTLLADVSCVLLDLGLADAAGLEGLHWLRRHVPHLAVVVLTGHADERRGEEAVSAGAQDYLVKGQVDGQLLGRVVRYAVERLRAVETQNQLRQAQLHAEERSAACCPRRWCPTQG